MEPKQLGLGTKVMVTEVEPMDSIRGVKVGMLGITSRDPNGMTTPRFDKKVCLCAPYVKLEHISMFLGFHQLEEVK